MAVCHPALPCQMYGRFAFGFRLSRMVRVIVFFNAIQNDFKNAGAAGKSNGSGWDFDPGHKGNALMHGNS